MKKIFLYLSIVVLYLLTPVCLIGALDTMVSLKYEVDDSYWSIDGNENLTADQKQKQVNELDNKGRQLKIQGYSLELFAFATFVVATGLMIKRKKYLVDRK